MAKQDLFDEQSFLIEFADIIENLSTGGKEKKPTSYENLVQVTGDSTGMANKLIDLPKMDILNTLSPAQISLLVPKIKIFKVLVDGTKLEFPINKTPTVDDILASLEQRGTDVGLKSFDWEDTGKSIGHGGVTRKARLVLYFQSFESLFMMRDATDSKGNKRKISFGDLVSTGYQESTNAMDIAATDANRPFPIQVEAGWSVPTDPSNILFSRSEIEEISNLTTTINLNMVRSGINFQENGAVVLDVDLVGRIEALMNSTTHDLFLVDESAEEAVVFAQTKKKRREDLRAAREELKEARKSLDELDERVKEAKENWKGKPKTLKNIEKTERQERASREKSIEKIEERIDVLKRKLGDLKNETLEKAWSKLIGRIDSISDGGDNKSGRMFYIQIPKEQLKAYMDAKKEIKEAKEQIPEISSEELRERRQEKLIEARKRYKRQIASELTNVKGAGQSGVKFSEAATNARKTTNEKNKTKEISKINRLLRNRRDLNKIGSDYRINFFFLGDLINAAMSIVNDRPTTYDKCTNNVLGKTTKSNDNYNETRLMLGTINILNRNTGRLEPKPLADIPISLNLFQEWWLRFVVRPERTSYSLQQFLIDCLGTLVTSAISPEDLGIGKLPQGATPKFTTLALPKGEAINEIWNGNYEKRISVDEVVSHRINRRAEKKQKTSQEAEEYLFIYTDSRSPIPGIGQNVFDLNESYFIPHIFAGNTRGMVKKVGFKRTPVPKRLEAQILNNKFGVQTNILLADKYDADISLYGCPLFVNGTQIYIDPRSLGLGNTPAARIREKILQDSNTTEGTEFKIWAEEIGIGGYYDILKVKHSIKSGMFTTTLETVNTVGLNILNSNKNSTKEKENPIMNEKINDAPKKRKSS